MKKVYITTPIYYPNSMPHLGSAYTTVIADFLARLYRSAGFDVFFLTGTDEHGEKLERKANELGKTPKEFVDEMVEVFKEAWRKLRIEPSRFIRTTEPEHEKVVKFVLSKLWEKGEIYRGIYRGLYCVGCERYYKPSDLVDGKLCPYHLKPVEEREIPAYFFRLSKYREKLLELYEKNPRFVPPARKEEIINRVRELEDLCISRPKEQLTWGIELPFDRDHVTYVWVDALSNYLTGAGFLSDSFEQIWPPDIQLMGKDIIWFHCVIWPALLMALGLELPKREVAHGFIKVDGKKMSKSLGNVIDPIELADKYGADFVRYLLVTKLPFEEDGNIDRASLPQIYRELAGNIGNLANRVLKLLKGVEIGEFEPDEGLKKRAEKIKAEIIEKLKELDVEGIIKLYSTEVIEFVGEINAYLNEKEPWKKEGKEKQNAVMNAYEALIFLFAFLAPMLVEGAEKFYSIVEKRNISRLREFGKNAPEIRPKEFGVILYPKIG